MFLYRLHAPNMQKLGKAVILIPLLFSLLGCDGPQQFEDGIAARDNHDYETARKIFSRLADQGDARAQDELAWMYAYGQGVEKNTTKALELLHSAASRGDVLAQFHLGLLYDGYDRLMTEQPEKAFEWYMKAAQQGFSQA